MVRKLHDQGSAGDRQFIQQKSQAQLTGESNQMGRTTRSAVARSKVRHRDERTGQLRQRLRPYALKRVIRYRVERVVHIDHGAQIIDMPVPRTSTVQMTAYARPQATRHTRTANVEIMAGGKAAMAQAANINRQRTRDK